jgi:hypothetical protein
MYKTPERIRKQAIQYYYDHREEVLARYAQQRREKGVGARQVARTNEEKLSIKIFCNRCARQVTTPSLILKCRRICIRCLKKESRERNWAKGLTGQGLVPKPSRVNAVTAFQHLKALAVCVRCGMAKSECLDFHHIDPKTKSFAISDKAGAITHEALLVEIAKCEILCANCHRTEHRGKSRKERS